MSVMDYIRFWFGILPKDSNTRLALLEQRCIDAVRNSGVSPPQQFENNMCAMAAWWAIPYHIYLFDEFGKREITPRLVQKASKMISAQAQRQLSFDPNSKKLGYGNVSSAMDLVIFDMCRLWQAVFRDNFDKNPKADYQQTVDYLKQTFTDPKLDLADKLWLYFETEEEKEQRMELYDDDDEEEMIDDLEDFADCVTRFYFHCTNKIGIS